LIFFPVVHQLISIWSLLTQVRLNSGDEMGGTLGVVPLVVGKELTQDKNGLSYCNGPYMVMER